jgi:hypothetical protein
VGAGNLRYKPHDVGISLGGGVSREPDYLALAGGGSVSLDLFEKNVTAVLGYSYGDETAGRTGTSYSWVSNRFTKSVPRLGLTVILTPSAVLDVVGEAFFESGNQAKPYRYVPFFAPDVAARMAPGTSGGEVNRLRLESKPLEQLPLARTRYALTARLSRRFSGSALRLEQRLYSDDWGLKGTTTDLRYILDVTRRAFVWPHLRAHLQTPVVFWKRAYPLRVAPDGRTALEAPPPLRTGDRELGPLRTFTAGGGLRFSLDGARHATWTVTLQGDVVFTRYLDALFISNRTAFFGALALETALE